MRRDILRFPVGPQFKKILEDDHEWCVITDMHFKILAATRGDKSSISVATIDETYQKVMNKKLHAGGKLHIYDLHNHPRGSFAPTPTDLVSFIDDKLNKNTQFRLFHSGIIIRGHGVISEKGIFLVTLPEKGENLTALYKRAPTKYFNTISELGKKKFDKRTWRDVKKHLKENPDQEQRLDKGVIRSFKKEEPDIRTKTIGRTHRFNMRRRR